MADRVAVTLTATGELLRWTSGDSDPTFDAGTETLEVLTLPVKLVAGVERKHHKVVDGVAVEMLQAGKDAVDANHEAANTPVIQQQIKDRLLGDALNGLAVSVTASGLVITTDIESLVDEDETTVVADGSNTKYVRLCYIYNADTDVFSIAAHEKTTGEYAALTPPEYLVRELGEFSVVASGTELVEV